MPRKYNSVILLSGGLDSALNLAEAAAAGTAKLAVTMRYGQRAEAEELRAAKMLAEFYKVPWREVDVSWLGEISQSGLNRTEAALPSPSLAELDDLHASEKSMRAVWVCNRNGVFLNIAAAFAEAIGCEAILAGFNREEAATFPDNSVEYMHALEASLRFSTQSGMKVESYTKDLTKPEIVARGLEIELPFHLVWSCYESGSRRCWRCESCKRTERALRSAGAKGEKVFIELGGML